MCAVTRLEDDERDKNTYATLITAEAHQKSNMHALSTYLLDTFNVLKIVQYIIHINRWAFNCFSLVIPCAFDFSLLGFACILYMHRCTSHISSAICLVNFVVVVFLMSEMATKKLSTMYGNNDSGSQLNSQTNILLGMQKTSWITSLKSNYVPFVFLFLQNK